MEEKRQLHNILVNKETGERIAKPVMDPLPLPTDQWWICAVTPGLMTKTEAEDWAAWWRSSGVVWVHRDADRDPVPERTPAPVTVRDRARQALHRALVVAGDGLVWLAMRL